MLNLVLRIKDFFKLSAFYQDSVAIKDYPTGRGFFNGKTPQLVFSDTEIP